MHCRKGEKYALANSFKNNNIGPRTASQMFADSKPLMPRMPLLLLPTAYTWSSLVTSKAEFPESANNK
jgi:hypothetical protein